jgi:hypothetical protein
MRAPSATTNNKKQPKVLKSYQIAKTKQKHTTPLTRAWKNPGQKKVS